MEVISGLHQLKFTDVHFFCLSKRNEPKKGLTVKKIALWLFLGKSRNEQGKETLFPVFTFYVLQFPVPKNRNQFAPFPVCLRTH